MSLIADLRKLKVYFYDQKDKRFIRAVEDMGFQVEKGAVMGMVGESGCGKTVTAQTMMGLVTGEPGVIGGEFLFRPDDASLPQIELALSRGMNGNRSFQEGGLVDLFHGLERYVTFRSDPFTIIKDSEKWLRRSNRIMEHVRGRNISMIFQNPVQSLNPFVPVGVQLEKTIGRFAAREMGEREIRERALELLDAVRLRNPSEVMNMYAGSLSVGIAQRVVIAVAIASRPCLLIADEPTSGLDTTTKHGVDADIKRGRRPRVIWGTVPDNKLAIDWCPYLDRCAYARGRIRKRCRTVRPELVEVSEGHYIRCYRYYR